MRGNEVLIEAFGRLPELVARAVEGLSPEQLRQAPAEGANTIGWLVWHLTRVQDSHLTELIGGQEVYVSGGWAPMFSQPADSTDTGYGHSAEQVAALAPETSQALLNYYAAVHERTLDYLREVSDDDLDRVVDKNWEPPVTLAVRLVSVYDDDAQHAGQAAYARGLLGL
ncbi:DinB family protein [Actinoplanes sp. NPDC049265]|uniref:mycothiol transferase n=1 Tax=Actinoplanes sp. NPDC049265 TaxID=3363902 RepID=UPI0037108E45